MTQADERKKLTHWAEVIRKDVQDIVFDDYIFREVRQIIGSNPRFTNAPGIFTQWMTSNFIQAAALGARRQADRGSDCISLHTFLLKVSSSPDLLSREYYVGITLQASDWPKQSAEEFANGNYDLLVGPGMSQPDPAQVQREIDELLAKTGKIRHYVDRRVAHYDLRGVQQPVPTFNDLDECLALFKRLIVKYYHLLTATDLGKSWPEFPFDHDWKGIFRFPWLEGPTKSGIPGRETSP
jgi:hypothetical protein